jgi:cobalamin biosynthesis protein CbiD
MNKKVASCAYQEKIQSLFSQSHKLLSAARQISETHARELECRMKESIEMARLAAKNDLVEIKIAQENIMKNAMKRLSSYQVQAELLLEEIGDDLQDNSHKMIDKARSHLTTWLEDTRSMVHKGEKNLGRLAKNIGEAGENLYQEGHQILMNATELAEKKLNKFNASEKQ